MAVHPEAAVAPTQAIFSSRLKPLKRTQITAREAHQPVEPQLRVPALPGRLHCFSELPGSPQGPADAASSAPLFVHPAIRQCFRSHRLGAAPRLAEMKRLPPVLQDVNTAHQKCRAPSGLFGLDYNPRHAAMLGQPAQSLRSGIYVLRFGGSPKRLPSFIPH